jgi:hypothetical protein
MLVIIAAPLTLILLVLFFYFIIPKNMSPVFWGKIELLWVMVSFLSVIYGITEVLNVDKKIEYEEMHNSAKIEFEEVQILIGEHLPTPDLHHTSEGQKEGLQWFHTMVNLMDDGYESKKWEDFVNYTEVFVFKARGFEVNEHIEALKYRWPQNPGFKIENIGYKPNIKLVADKLGEIEKEKEQLLKKAPNSKPVTWPRYLIAFAFLIGLSLKINKIRYEAYR